MAAEQDSALRGRRVLELADEKGVYCGKLLADMGADVIKIERPGGDATRRIPPFWQDEAHPEKSLFFMYMNASKRGVTLDITKPEGRDIFKQLAQTADIILETFPPGYLDALGLGYETLKGSNRRLVLTSITGFGQTGPYKDFKAADIVAAALGGAMYVTGEAEPMRRVLSPNRSRMAPNASQNLQSRRRDFQGGTEQRLPIFWIF